MLVEGEENRPPPPPHEATARRPEGKKKAAAHGYGGGWRGHRPPRRRKDARPPLAGPRPLARHPDRCSPAATPWRKRRAAARHAGPSLAHHHTRPSPSYGEEDDRAPFITKSRSAMKRGVRRPPCVVARPLAEEELGCSPCTGRSPIAMLHATTPCFDEGPPCPLLDDGRPPEEKATQPTIRRVGRFAARPAAARSRELSPTRR
ncbi:hypothetical protein Dimus_037214 [Dionaea muscipula]